MFGIFMSALNAALGFVFRGIVVKFLIFVAIFYVTTGLVPLLANLLPNASVLSLALAQIPSSMWYWLDLFKFTAGLPVVVSALATRFVIRRIPMIG